jgi:hypothetical protein
LELLALIPTIIAFILTIYGFYYEGNSETAKELIQIISIFKLIRLFRVFRFNKPTKGFFIIKKNKKL